MTPSALTLFIAAAATGFVQNASETYTPDPGSWRPLEHSDLRFPTGEAQSYASIWQDRLDESNAKPVLPTLPGSPSADPSMSYAVGNRGAEEQHFSINFQTKLVVITVLHTPNVCTDEYPSPSIAAKVKICPMRLLTFEGGHYSQIDGAACFLEKQPQAPIEDSSATAAYAAYDVDARAIKLRYTVSHTPVPQCDQSVLLHPKAAGATR